eukprot:4630278-Lingulodinium_polyedra.AAC.1
MVQRSFLNNVVLQEWFAALKALDFKSIPDGVVATLEEVFAVPGTKLCEDAFHFERLTEDNQQSNQ